MTLTGYLLLSLVIFAAGGLAPLLIKAAAIIGLLLLAGITTDVLTLNWNHGSTQILNSVNVTADGSLGWDDAIPAPSTDLQININMVVANIKEIYISSDQDLTIETNSGSSPVNTLNILAGKPLVWYTGCGLANPLTTNVTAFFITKGAGTAANLKMQFLVDTTP